MTSLAPVPAEALTCANCSAPLVADQRYCLSCGAACSPVRLAFLDVLDGERQPAPGTGLAPVAYAPYVEPAAGPAWLRRYAPLFAVASVLLLAMIAGLLVGHWITQKNAPSGPQVIRVEGLGSSLPAATAGSAGPATGTAATPATSAKTGSASAAKEEETEQAEAKAEEKAEEKAPAKAPPAKKLSPAAVNKLEKTTGSKHEAELNKLTTAPIEVK